MIGIVFILLCILSWQDIKYKHVNGWIVMGLIIGLIMFNLTIKQQSLKEIFLDTGLGMVLLLVSAIWREKIGSGDGLVCGIVGLALGVLKGVQVVVLALFLAALFGMCKMIIFHGNQAEPIAFIPFITVTYGILCFGF